MLVPLNNTTTYERKRFEKVALIDADFLKYYVTADIANVIAKEGHPKDKYGPDYVNWFTEKRMSEMIFEKMDCWGYIFCFSGSSKDTFRYKCSLEKEYKGNRGAGDESYEGAFHDMSQVISCVNRNNMTLVYYDLEADDILSVLQNQYTFIFSHDKDMKQVPGAHYDMGSNTITFINDEQTYSSLAWQLLIGDKTDNICGIPGIGEKKAAEILDGVLNHKMIETAHFEYIKKFGIIEGNDRFCETWNLIKLRMDRGDWFRSKLKNAFEMRDLIIKNNVK